MSVHINNKTFTAEYLSTPEDIERGMMGREELNGCMVFKMGRGHHSFWMKNCLIPLDIIFKQIHATKGSETPYYYPSVPFIKYNPGKRRESMFRFYSENISKDGKKIPWLTKKQINAISKENKKFGNVIIILN